MSAEIFIPYDVRSSKNGRRAKTVWSKKTGKKYSAIIPSTAVDEYVYRTKFAYSGGKAKFLQMIKDKPKPYYIGFRFARATLGRWDFHNMVQIVCDLMVKNEWLEDDDVSNMIAVYVPHHKDKDKPGVFISVL